MTDDADALMRRFESLRTSSPPNSPAGPPSEPPSGFPSEPEPPSYIPHSSDSDGLKREAALAVQADVSGDSAQVLIMRQFSAI